MLGKILKFIRPEKPDDQASANAEPPTKGDAATDSPFPPKMDPHRRTTWIPQVEDRTGQPGASRFSGVALLAEGEDWPACQNCEQPMQLFLQVASHELPKDAGKPFGDGILQVFYCTNYETMCDVEAEAWEPFSEGKLLRVLPLGGPFQQLDASPVDGAFPSRVIVGWQAAPDFPNPWEAQSLGMEFTDEEFDQLCDVEFPVSGEKLLGWPYWVQGVEYPDCRVCGRRMDYVFQIDSERNLPFMFGDVGVAHVCQCPEHREEIGFGWACH